VFLAVGVAAVADQAPQLEAAEVVAARQRQPVVVGIAGVLETQGKDKLLIR